MTVSCCIRSIVFRPKAAPLPLQKVICEFFFQPFCLHEQVIWVDLLTEEEFTAGFGSHTPIFTGQTKCARYYMNFKRALALLKEVLAEVRPF